MGHANVAFRKLFYNWLFVKTVPREGIDTAGKCVYTGHNLFMGTLAVAWHYKELSIKFAPMSQVSNKHASLLVVFHLYLS